MKKELTIGFCVVVALFALFLGINFLKGINIFKAANYYYATYTNAAGLQVSAPVMLNGYKVGQVREINYEYDNLGHVKAELSIDRALKLPKGTMAVIEQDLLGTATVVLHPTAATTFEEVGATLKSETASGMMEAVQQKLMPNLEGLFVQVDSLVRSLNVLASNPALTTSVNRLDAITLHIERTLKTINASMKSLPPVMNNVNDISDNLKVMSGALAELSSDLKELPIDTTMQNVAALSANLKTLSESLNRTDSSLGLITHDRALYDNLNNCAASLDSLLIDVKRNPKRYISIKLL